MRLFVSGVIVSLFFALFLIACDSDCTQEIFMGDEDTEVDGDDDLAIDGDFEIDDKDLPAAKIAMSNEVSFGAARLNQSVERSLAIVNEGSANLEIFDIRTVDSTSEFSVGPWDSSPILPGDLIELQLFYEPVDGEADNGTLLVYSNDPTRRVAQVDLTSVYKGTANIETDMAELDFGVVSVGETSAVRKIRINNESGSSDDNRVLTVSDLLITNEAGGVFQLAKGNPKLPFIVGPNGHVDISLVFVPKSWGDVADVLQIESDSNLEADRLLEVNLSGRGGAQRLCVIPDPVIFGSVKAQTSAMRTITLEACGEASVTPTAISLESDSSESFSLNALPELGNTLELGQDITFELVFSPDAQLGLETASLKIESDDLFFPIQEVAVTGQGAISDLFLVPSSVAFGDVLLGQGGEATLLIRNVGLWDVIINDFEFAPEAAPFEVENSDTLLPITIPGGGQSVEINILYTPTKEGVETANMTIRSDNSLGDLTVGISGRGVAAHLELSQDTLLEFGEARLGEKLEKPLILKNVGRAPLSIENLEITSGDDRFGFDPGTVDASLAYLEEVELTMSYLPTSEVGDDDGKFAITSDSYEGTRQTVEIDLHGSSVDPSLALDPSGPTYDFGPVNVGACVGPLEVLVTNDGFGTLLVENILAYENFGGVFSLVVEDVEFPHALRPHDTYADELSFYVTFCPETESEDYSAAVQIISNDFGQDDYRFVFSGGGGGCPLNHINCDDDPAVCETYCEGGPENEELCNGIDDNCDCRIDEGFALGDFCDGVGECSSGITECDPSDSTKTICSTSAGGSDYDGSTEQCNAVDDDCDGLTDEGFTVDLSTGQALTCNGIGQCGDGYFECKGLEEVRCSTDIGGSADQSIEEICDGFDNDCDGATDELWQIGQTCSGTGQCLDGVWECDGEEDRKCSTLPGGSAYSDLNEICDGLDNDCDGLSDEGFAVGQSCLAEGECGEGVIECSGADSTVCSTDIGGSQYDINDSQLAGDPESCDGLDNDCDGLSDEGFTVDAATGNALTCNGIGECGAGVKECATPTTVRCSTDPGGTAPEGVDELCNDADDDCDGQTDEHLSIGLECQGTGECGAGVWECQGLYSRLCSTDPGGSGYDINDPLKAGNPETCNGLDDNCNGLTDEDYSVGAACLGIGECGLGTYECSGLDDSICSTDIGGSEYINAPEECDNKDNDCDGQVDEDFPLGESCTGEGECSGVSGVWLCGEDGEAKCSADYTGEDESCNGLDDDCDGTTDEVCRIEVYRHSFSDVTDRDATLSRFPFSPPGFSLDGMMFRVYSEDIGGMLELFAVYNATETDHIYTTDFAEVLSLTGTGQWVSQSAIGFVMTSDPGNEAIPLYRLANASYSDHVYTVEESEKDALVLDGYILEGVAGWVWPL